MWGERPAAIPLISQYRGLPRQVYLLLLCRIVTSMGMFVFPFLTLFLSGRLHFSDAEIGRYLLLAALTIVPGALLGGKLADRFRRKYVYITMVVISDIFYILAGFYCERLWVVWPILGGYAFLNMGNPILAAMMMDLTQPENRQESFSLIYLGYNLGFAVGPMLAGLMFENYTRWLFFGQASMTLCAALLIGLLIRDATPGEEERKRVAADKSRAREQAQQGSLLRQLARSPLVAAFALLASAYAFSYSQINYILPLQMADLFGISRGARYFGVVWSLNGLCVFLFAPLAVLVFKRFPPLFNMAVTGLMYCLGFGLYAALHEIGMMYGLVALWSAGEVVAATNSGVFIANHSPISHRARFQSLYDVIQGLGRSFGPLVMGSYLTGHEINSAWLVLGGICGAAAAAFFIMNRLVLARERKSQGLPAAFGPEDRANALVLSKTH